MENETRYHILDWQYDGQANKTHAQVQTPYGTDWWYISGRVSRGDFLACIAPVVEAREG